MNYLVLILIVLIITVYLLFLKLNNKQIEKFKDVKNNIKHQYTKAFKKNIDLHYYDLRGTDKINNKKKYTTNQLAPIMNKNRTNRPFKNKLPDILNNNNKITKKKKGNLIPLPKFDDLEKFKPIIEKISESNKIINYYKNMKIFANKKNKDILDENHVTDENHVIEERSIAKETPNNINIEKKKDTDVSDENPVIEKYSIPEESLHNNILEKNLLKNTPIIKKHNITMSGYKYNPLNSFDGKCKFIESHGNKKCNSKYSIYTGATFSGRGSNLQCGNAINQKRAEAIAVIKDGSIVDTVIIEEGSYYLETPNIKVNGTDGDPGGGAILNAVILNNKLKSIKILNGGINYNSTPKIIIGKPNMEVSCNLCCKP